MLLKDPSSGFIEKPKVRWLFKNAFGFDKIEVDYSALEPRSQELADALNQSVGSVYASVKEK